MDFYAIFGTPQLCPSEPPGSAEAVHLAAESIIYTYTNESCRSQCMQLTLGQLNMNIVSSRPSVFSHVHTD